MALLDISTDGGANGGCAMDIERQILVAVARVDIFLVSAWAVLRVIVPIAALLTFVWLATRMGRR